METAYSKRRLNYSWLVRESVHALPILSRALKASVFRPFSPTAKVLQARSPLPVLH
jgi:hypothetical protein